MEDRLYRSRADRIFAGVAGGLADRWDADPSLVRLVWALLVVFTGGIALLVYVIMAFVVPEAPVEVASAPVPTAPGVASDAPPQGAYFSTPSPYSSAPTPAERRAIRREARRSRRSGRDGQTAAIIGGLILIALGSMFLLREWFPRLDFDSFWPMVLIAIGMAIVVIALGRRSDPAGVEPTPRPGPSGVATSQERQPGDMPEPRPM